MTAARQDKIGALTVPLTATVATGGSLATLVDPAINGMLAAFKAIVNTKMGAAWVKAASQMSASGYPVVGTYPYEPIPTMALRTWKWPALFMWRQKEKLFRRTQVYRGAECEGKLVYVLPPLPYDVAIRLEPIRVAVRTCLDTFIEQHGDPSYSSGASPITAAGLESFEFTGADYGWLPSSETLQQPHPMVEFTWKMRERQSFVAGNYSALTRITTTVAVVSETATSSTTGATAAVMDFNATGGVLHT